MPAISEKISDFKDRVTDGFASVKGSLPNGASVTHLKDAMNEKFQENKGVIYHRAAAVSLAVGGAFLALSFLTLVFGIAALSSGLAAAVGVPLLVFSVGCAVGATAAGCTFNYFRKKAASEGHSFI